MTESLNDKVYLLPHTIEYYQKELTRLLEFERYGEAAAMLQFLLSCESNDAEAREEWGALLNWIVTIFPEIREEEAEADHLTEADLFHAHMKDRAAHEPGYTEKLLEVFRDPELWDKQVLALEQLRYLEHPDINAALVNWLQGRPLPPSLQFRALQILKLRGVDEPVRMRRHNQNVTVQIQDVPTGFDEYPLPFQEVYQRVAAARNSSGMPLDEFAAETWSEFVAFAFGTPYYLELLTATTEEWDAWAAAFHYILLQTAQGSADADEIKEHYIITEELENVWDRAVQVFTDFVRTAFPDLS